MWIDSGGLQQPSRYRDIVETFFGNLETAIEPHIDCGAGECAGDRRIAIDDGGGGIDGQRRRQQLRRDAGQQRAGHGLAGGGEAAGFAGQGNIGDRLAAQLRIKAAAPVGPGAITGQPGFERCRQAEKGDDGAAIGGDDQAIDLELVGIGLGIEMQAQRVAAALGGFAERQRGQIDERPALADVELAADAENAALAGHGGFEHQPIDAEAGDGEIEIGEEGFGRRRVELGQPQKLQFGGRQPLGGEGLGGEIERSPIDIDARHPREHALGVGEFKAVNGGDAEDRAIDTIGADAEADFGFDARQLLDEEGAASVAIEPAQRAIGERGKRQHHQHDGRQHAGDAGSRREARAACWGFGSCVVGHQKA